MPQPSIPLEPGRMYHIWTLANGNKSLFREDENFAYFLEMYTWYIEPVAETFAYCLMLNHLHLMVRIRGVEEVLEILRVRRSNLNLTFKGFETLVVEK